MSKRYLFIFQMSLCIYSTITHASFFTCNCIHRVSPNAQTRGQTIKFYEVTYTCRLCYQVTKALLRCVWFGLWGATWNCYENISRRSTRWSMPTNSAMLYDGMCAHFHGAHCLFIGHTFPEVAIARGTEVGRQGNAKIRKKGRVEINSKGGQKAVYWVGYRSTRTVKRNN